MSNVSETPCGLSAWAAALASAAIAVHLLAVVIEVLAAPSGPWPTDGGSTFSTPPQFAYSLSAPFSSTYLQSLGLLSHYRFNSNRPAVPSAYLEFRLKDKFGRIISTLVLPSADANFPLRHRHSLLALALVDDQPVAPPQGEVIAAPNRALPSEQIWDLRAPAGLVLQTTPQHLIPRDRPVFRPSEQSLLLARSYARYLCRTQGAATAELIRHTQEPIPPAAMFIHDPREADASRELVSYFGELNE